MDSRPTLWNVLAPAILATALVTPGCHDGWARFYQRPVAQPLGAISDSVWQRQEANAEHSDFVIYEHEFADGTEFLNTGGEDHVKQIAARLAAGQDAQVLVERSRSSARAGTVNKYRVHPNPDLDLCRREIIVRSLATMGIPDAENRVVVAPALAPKYRTGDSPTGTGEGTVGSGGYGNFSGYFFGPRF